MPANAEIGRMEAVELAERVRAKELSPVEVVDAVLERMDRLEPMLHAFCTPTPDLAREEARRLEREISDGADPGPLAGVPVGIKDLHAVKGVRMVLGSHAYKDFVPDEDDVSVERLREAGAIILGKTNVPEFGYSGVGHNPVFETTTNPWDASLTPGGSSAGSGAAVASGMGPIALGSDGGGSVRIPSSFCGLFGMKASMGRVPLYPSCRDERYPGASGWESLEHIGPMSRTVRDGALMLSVMAGPDERDRLSIPEEASFDPLEAIGSGLPRGCAWPTARTGATRRWTRRCGGWSERPPGSSRAISGVASRRRTRASRTPTRRSGASSLWRPTSPACAGWPRSSARGCRRTCARSWRWSGRPRTSPTR